MLPGEVSPREKQVLRFAQNDKFKKPTQTELGWVPILGGEVSRLGTGCRVVEVILLDMR